MIPKVVSFLWKNIKIDDLEVRVPPFQETLKY